MKYNIHSFLGLIGMATAVFYYQSELRIARLAMNFRCLLVANFIHYSSGTDLLVSVAESRLTASKDFRFRTPKTRRFYD